MSTYVEIAVNVPQVMGVFHYHLPVELEGQVSVGHLVSVPFGKRTVQGVVLRSVNKPAVSKTKPVKELLDPEAVLTGDQILLAEMISERLLAPLASCISLMLPAGLSKMADTLYSPIDRGLVKEKDWKSGKYKNSEIRKDIYADLSNTQKKIINLLHKRGPLRGRQIDRSLPRLRWRQSVPTLVKRGIISSQSILLPPSVRPKTIRTAQLACSPDIAEAQMDKLGRSDSLALKRRQKILQILIRESDPVDVSWVYAESKGNSADLKKLSQMGLIILGESEVWRDPLERIEFVAAEPPQLTSDQEVAWSEINRAMQSSYSSKKVKPYLLYGVTGSGKTEIYLRAVDAVIRRGKQSIVLVPEISLTPQTVRRFMARFPGRVGLVHSRLSQGERYDTWRRARGGSISVVIGPRSALFTPFPNLGLIVVDECHDGSYYQSELQPRYHARELAVQYAGLIGGICVLGSATPDVVSTYQAQRGVWQALKLPGRILAHKETVREQVKRLRSSKTATNKDGEEFTISRYQDFEKDTQFMDLPPVEVVDMRKELKAGNRSIFSRSMQAALGKVLDEGQQAILFLNRRGTATYIFCRDCGNSMRCPRCDISLTYHRSTANLICHHCGYQRMMPKICPKCKSLRIRQYGTGTERVEGEVKKLLPQARTLRWDWETTRKKGAHEAILSHFANHRADVLIGTQMLAKGLDLPFVTFVGVVLADVGLNLPDYRASERTFQVLTQVAGRAGRSPLGGEVIFQTFQPDHYVIKAASRHAYGEFYRYELGYRRKLRYPPFSRLVRLEIRNHNEEQVKEAAHTMAKRIRGWLHTEDRRQTNMIGPVPCFYGRVGGVYRWQIILRGPNPASMLGDRRLGDWRVEVDPISLL